MSVHIYIFSHGERFILALLPPLLTILYNVYAAMLLFWFIVFIVGIFFMSLQSLYVVCIVVVLLGSCLEYTYIGCKRANALSLPPPRSLYIYRQRYCQCEIMENCEWRIANARKVSMEYDVGRLVKAICTWTYIEAIQIIKLATITWDISKSSEREHRFSSAQQYHYGI